MTTYVIGDPTTDLTDKSQTLAQGDVLLVTSTGWIVNNQGDGVDAAAGANAITIDGSVYNSSAGVVIGNGGTAAAAPTPLVVNGQVEGETGVIVSNAPGSSVTVGSQG
jgi:hypothetical protein